MSSSSRTADLIIASNDNKHISKSKRFNLKGIVAGNVSLSSPVVIEKFNLNDIEVHNNVRLERPSSPSSLNSPVLVSVQEKGRAITQLNSPQKLSTYRTVNNKMENIVDSEIIRIQPAGVMKYFDPNVSLYSANTAFSTLSSIQTEVKKQIENVHANYVGDHVEWEDQITAFTLNETLKHTRDNTTKLRRYKLGISPLEKTQLLQRLVDCPSKISLEDLSFTNNTISGSSKQSQSRKSTLNHDLSAYYNRVIPVRKSKHLELYELLNPPLQSPQSANAGSKKGDPMYNRGKFRKPTSDLQSNTNDPNSAYNDNEKYPLMSTYFANNDDPRGLEEPSMRSHESSSSPTIGARITSELQHVSQREPPAVEDMPLSMMTNSKIKLQEITFCFDCIRCAKTGLLWCPNCAKSYCFNCWSTVPHHRQLNAIQILSQTTAEKAHSESEAAAMHVKKTRSPAEKGKSPPIIGDAKAVTLITPKMPSSFRDYHSDPIYLSGTGNIKQISHKGLAELLRKKGNNRPGENEKITSENGDNRNYVYHNRPSSTSPNSRLKVINMIENFKEFQLETKKLENRNVDNQGEFFSPAQRSKMLEQKLKVLRMREKRNSSKNEIFHARSTRHETRPHLAPIFSLGEKSVGVSAPHKARMDAVAMTGISKNLDIEIDDAASEDSEKFENVETSYFNGKIVYTIKKRPSLT